MTKKIIPDKVPSFQQGVTELNLKFFLLGMEIKNLILQKVEY